MIHLRRQDLTKKDNDKDKDKDKDIYIQRAIPDLQRLVTFATFDQSDEDLTKERDSGKDKYKDKDNKKDKYI